ncbi:MAG: hypothetical protein AAFX05_13570, partial [Planctomycetota bacterium]
MSATLTCAPPPSSGPTVVGPFPIGPGFNFIPTSITVPAFPPRVCTLAVVSTVTFTDGTSLTLRGDVEVCIVEEAPPAGSGIPRLDLVNLTPLPHGVHAGDQAVSRYSLTNNDPLETWTGTIDADFVSTAAQPIEAGPLPPFRTAFSASDPLGGDAWGIDFLANLPPGGCIPFPPNPSTTFITTATLLPAPIVLPPGGTISFEVAARPYRKCANGSCGESNVRAIGLYTDGTTGHACASAVYYVDNSIPPAYAWPDAGGTATCVPEQVVLPPGGMVLHVEPGAAVTAPFDFGVWPDPGVLFVGGAPAPTVNTCDSQLQQFDAPAVAPFMCRTTCIYQVERYDLDIDRYRRQRRNVQMHTVVQIKWAPKRDRRRELIDARGAAHERRHRGRIELLKLR